MSSGGSQQNTDGPAHKWNLNKVQAYKCQVGKTNLVLKTV